jgi:hypothetical protein
MDSYDQYEETKKIAQLLTAEGHAAKAQELLSALTEGRTGTEIFMVLRYRLTPLLNAPGLSTEVEQRISVLYESVNAALK